MHSVIKIAMTAFFPYWPGTVLSTLAQDTSPYSELISTMHCFENSSSAIFDQINKVLNSTTLD